MSRTTKFIVGIIVLLGIVGGAAGYFLYYKAEDTLISVVEKFRSELPPGTTLEWGTISARDGGLGLDLTDVRFRGNAGFNMDAAQVSLTSPSFGLGGLESVDVKISGASSPSSQNALTGQTFAWSADLLSIEKIDLNWFRKASRIPTNDPNAIYDPELWKTFNMGPLVVEKLHIDGMLDSAGSMDYDRSQIGAIKSGIVSSYELSNARQVDEEGVLTTIESFRLEDIDLPWTLTLVNAIRNNDERAAYNPEFWATYSMGPSVMKRLTVVPASDDEPTVRIDTLEHGRITNGKITDARVKGIIVESADADVDIGEIRQDGLDLALVFREVSRASFGSTLSANHAYGMNLFSLSDVVIRQEYTQTNLYIERVALEDFKRDTSGNYLGSTLDITHLGIPVELLFDPLNRFMAQQGDRQLTINGKLVQQLDAETRRLRVDPLALDLSQLGGLQIGLDLGGIDFATLMAAPENVAAVLMRSRLEHVGLQLHASSATNDLLEFVFADKGTNKDQAIAMIQAEAAPALSSTLGADTAQRAADALSSFVRSPGAFAVSIRAKEGKALDLQTLTGLLPGGNARLMESYDVEITSSP